MWRNAELGAAAIADVDIDAFFLQTQELHLGNVGDAQQAIAYALGVVLQFGVAEVLALQGVDVAEGVEKFVVERWTDDSCRQRMANVANFLAHLIVVLRHGVGRHIFAEDDEDLRLTGT